MDGVRAAGDPLLSGAALCLERAGRRWRLPTRFGWWGAVAGSLGLPLAVWLLVRPGSVTGPGGEIGEVTFIDGSVPVGTPTISSPDLVALPALALATALLVLACSIDQPRSAGVTGPMAIAENPAALPAIAQEPHFTPYDQKPELLDRAAAAALFPAHYPPPPLNRHLRRRSHRSRHQYRH